jgi:hypothetical protein
LARDPNNLYLSHANLRRLEAEAIRDSLLSASGDLDRTLFGAPVGGESNRRSLYVAVIRNNLDPLLRSFDFPEPSSATGRRDVTNVPAQSLTLLNDPQVNRWATSLAESVMNVDANAEHSERQHADRDAAPAAGVDDARLERLFLTLLSRPPTEDELASARAYLKATRESFELHNRQHAGLKRQLEIEEQTIAAMLEMAREKIEADTPSSHSLAPPDPIASWDFEEGLADSIAGLDSIPHGNVRIEQGKLLLNSGAYVTTPPLETTLIEKTLEAWVQLENLDQRGGGVLSVQSPDGRVFDAIVFGEIQPGHWLAGSDFHQRTKPLGGDAESQAIEKPVHLAICYQGDGQIVAYRDGVPYGKAYRTSPPVRFENAVVSIGLRHLPAGGNRLLAGKIEHAAIYNRALTADEVAASFQRGGGRPSRKQLLAAMTPQQQRRLAKAESARDHLRDQLDSLGPIRKPLELAAWTEMSRALMLLKEFIYVR